MLADYQYSMHLKLFASATKRNGGQIVGAVSQKMQASLSANANGVLSVATWPGSGQATWLVPSPASCDTTFYIAFDRLKRFWVNLLSCNMMENNRKIMRRYKYWSKIKVSR
jgi:hypothetical protein